MKIYLASAYQTRDVIRGYAAELSFIDMKCTSSWLNEEHKISAGTVGAATDLEDAQVRQHVMNDYNDVSDSDVLVLFTESVTGEKGGGGRHVETGFALAKGKKVIVIGEPENVFHRGPQVTIVPNWHEALLQLVHWRNLEELAVGVAVRP